MTNKTYAIVLEVATTTTTTSKNDIIFFEFCFSYLTVPVTSPWLAGALNSFLLHLSCVAVAVAILLFLRIDRVLCKIKN